MTRIVDRNEDMSARGRLRLIQQEDGDIIVAVQPEENGLIAASASVEFCSPVAGGGRSPRTLAALRALMDAMEQDNAERPIATTAAQSVRDAAQPIAPEDQIDSKPVTAYLEDDGVEHAHPKYGRGVFFTYNCAQELYRKPDTLLAEHKHVERYQFLRGRTVQWNSLNPSGWMTGEKLDRAIDSAIAATSTIAPGKDKP